MNQIKTTIVNNAVQGVSIKNEDDDQKRLEMRKQALN